MISANLAQNRVRLIHGFDLYMSLYGTYFTGIRDHEAKVHLQRWSSYRGGRFGRF